MILEPWEMKAADHLMDVHHLDPIKWHYTAKHRSQGKDGWMLIFKTRGVIPNVRVLPITDKEVELL